MTDHPSTPNQRVRPGADWRRYWRLMGLMTFFALAAMAAAAWYLYSEGVPFRLHFVIALGGGILLSVLLGGALMGLVFLSNRSGHDESVGHAEDEQV